MHNSLRRKDMTTVAKMLDADPSLLNTPNEKGESLLHRCVRLDAPSHVSMLLVRGINTGLKDRQGSTALNVAVHEVKPDKNPNLEEIIRLLITNGACVFTPNPYGKVPICTLIARHQADLVRLAFTRRPDLVNMRVRDFSQGPQAKCPDIHLRISWRHSKPAPFRLMPNRQHDPTLWRTQPLLAFAIRARNIEAVKALLDCGASPNAVVGYKATVLDMDDLVHCPAAAVALIKAGATIPTPEAIGWTALHSAAGDGDGADLIVVLLKAGFCLEARMEDGATALHHAVSMERLSPIRVLIEAGANIEATNVYGTTPLFTAVQDGWEEGVSFLLAKGANVDHVDCEGNSVLHYSVDSPYHDITRLLVQAGADVDRENALGVSPLAMSLAISGQQLSNCLLRHSKRYYVPAGMMLTSEQKDELLEYAISANPHGLCKNDYEEFESPEVRAMNRDLASKS